MNASDLGVDTAPKIQQIKVEEPPKRKAGIKVSSVAELVQKLKNTDDQEEYASDIRTEYDDLRREYYDSQKDKAFVSLGKARSKKMKTDWDNVKIVKPTFLGTKVYK